MRKLILLLLSLFIISTANGQHSEFSFHLNSGLFSFAGKSATAYSTIVVNDAGSEGHYTNNPYGSQKTFSYGLTAQFKRITKYKLIYGLEAGYELLRSRVNIDNVAGDFPNPPSSTSGETIFKNGFVVIHPTIGGRLNFSNLNIDLTIGPELGFNVVCREKGKATTNNNIILKTDRKRNHPGTDFRLRSSLIVYYQNWGISTGYSYGLRNYSNNIVGGNRERFSRFIRFGVTYRIK
jgi:hypothetical protein